MEIKSTTLPTAELAPGDTFTSELSGITYEFRQEKNTWVPISTSTVEETQDEEVTLICDR